MSFHPLDASGRRALANALGDSPWTATATHLLRRGLCTAYVDGGALSFDAAAVFWNLRPDAAVTFGTTPEAIWRLLQGILGWRTINIDETHAHALGKTLERELGRPVRYHGEPRITS